MRKMARVLVGFGCIGLLVFLQGQLCAAPAPDREAIVARSKAAAKTPAKPEGRDVIYVPDDYPAIQGAIDAASNGDTVIVREGEYYENINFGGKAVTVRSEDPEDPAAVAATVIDGGGAGTVVTFDSGETSAAVLSGFTICNGAALSGGGIYCEESSPTISNSIIRDNAASSGGGINIAWYSSPTVINTIIIRNFETSENSGAGGVYCNPYSSPSLINTVIAYNASLRNSYYGSGGISGSPDTTITNSIIWGNMANDRPQVGGSPVITYSDIQGGYEGAGNIDREPLFVNPAAGDYRLIHGSPCIDGGTATGAPDIDFEGDARPNGSGVDMGADEWYLADTDGDGMDDHWERHYFGDLCHGPAEDYDGDEITNGQEYQDGTDPAEPHPACTYYIDCSTGDDSRGAAEARSAGTPWRSIGRALAHPLVCRGDTVVVAGGTYYENINLHGKAVTLRSTDPGDPAVVAATVLDGAESGSVVTCSSGEGPDTEISGFTIRNGKAGFGGGICCEWSSSPTITDNVIRNNSAIHLDFAYGGAGYKGAGIYLGRSSASVIARNIIMYSDPQGIYCHDSSPRIESNIIRDNAHGGIYLHTCSSPVVSGNIIADNIGGGVGCMDTSSPVFTNNVIVGNVSSHGGGLGFDDKTIPIFVNNTVAYNVANSSAGSGTSKGGGIYCRSATIRNCIFWGNIGQEGAQIYDDGDATVTYSNVQGGWGGLGNIDADPLLVNPYGGDCHLACGSPCIDSGTDQCAPDADFEGDARPNGSGVDMGADEWYLADTDGDGMDDSWERLYFDDLSHGPDEDYDGDGATNGEEYASGADPTDAHPSCTYYVDSAIGDDSRTAIEARNPGTAWESISRALECAMVRAGDTVIVGEGIYREDIRFHGKAITLRSTDPGDPAVVSGTVIDGGRNTCVVRFDAGEDSDSVLSGFTIRNGKSPEWEGGGIYCVSSSPTVANCTITENTAARDGGGIFCGESASPQLVNLTITHNWAGEYGGGIACHWYSSPEIINTVIAHNSSDGVGGGGAYFMAESNPALTNVTIVHNSSGIFDDIDSYPTIRNCILWENGWANAAQIHLRWTGPPDVSYTVIRGGWPGEGNTAERPRFVDPEADDFHLIYGSPGIDIGTAAGAPESDFEGEGRPNGGGVDMGADEWYFADTDGDGMGDHWERRYFGDLFHGPAEDYDGDGMTNGQEHENGSDPASADYAYYVNSLSGNDSRTANQARDPATPWKTITRALGDAVVDDGDTVVVCPGIYYENIDCGGKAVTVRSTEPENRAVVESTIIDGGGAGSVVVFDSVEAPDSVLSGLTIRNGSAEYGGGIFCEGWASPTLTGNIITSNSAENGGGVYCNYSSASLVDNTISGNSASLHAGGLYFTGYGCPVLKGNIISGNNGSGVYCTGQSDLAITANTITGNSGESYGGGIFCYETPPLVIEGNTIKNNSCSFAGGGIYIKRCSPTLTNNIIHANTAGNRAGGIYCYSYADATLLNNTIIGNDGGSWGGGIFCNYYSSPVVVNSILRGNTADVEPQIYCDDYSSLEATYSDIQGGWPGEGNIDADPFFVDPGDNLHLVYGSPCIDAGTGVEVHEDFEGDHRPLDGDSGGTAEHDMGADEYDPATADSDGDGLLDTEEVAMGIDPRNADTDGDGVSDYDEVNWDGDPATYDPYDPGSGTGTDLNATDPDSDGDGYTDYIELESGTDPIDQESKPGILRLNFQPASSDIPPGFLKDNGGGYTGMGYGWL